MENLKKELDEVKEHFETRLSQIKKHYFKDEFGIIPLFTQETDTTDFNETGIVKYKDKLGFQVDIGQLK